MNLTETYKEIVLSESDLTVRSWKLHPDANPENYKIDDDWNNVRQKWKAKTLVANNGGKKGDFEEVGYIWFNEKDKTFLPISRDDEHHLGSDMMYDMKYARYGYHPIFMWGNNYVYDDKERLKIYAILKELIKDGYEPVSYINDYSTRNKIPMIDFANGTGSIEPITGQLNSIGKKFIDDLTKLADLDKKILATDPMAHRYENMVKKYKNDAVKIMKFANNNWLWIYKWDYDKNIKEMKRFMNNEAGFKDASNLMFGFGFKNAIHRHIKKYVEMSPKEREDDTGCRDFVGFFGDLEMALGLFNKLDE